MSKAKARVLACMLVFCLVFTGLFTRDIRKVDAAENNNDILTGYLITLNGSELNNSSTIKNGDKLAMILNWALKDGDKTEEYILDLDTKGIRLSTNGVQLDVKDGTSAVVGKYWIDEEGKIHIKFDPNTAFFKKYARTGGVTLDGVVDVDRDTVANNERTQIGLVTEPYDVTFSHGGTDSWLEVKKGLSGGVTKDGSGNLWQEFQVTMTAYNNTVKGIQLTEQFGSGLSNLKDITLNGTVSGGNVSENYSSLADLNTALANTTLAKDNVLTLTYKMQVNDGIYEQNADPNNYSNHLKAVYKNNKDANAESDSEWVVVKVNKPTVAKSGVASADGSKVTWTVTINLGDFKDDGFAAVTSITDLLGTGLDVADVPANLISQFTQTAPGVYTASFTTDVTYNKLNTAKNTVQMVVDGKTYTGEAQVGLNPPKWIFKSFRGKEGDLLVWDVFLNPTADMNLSEVVLEDFLDGGNYNKQVFVNGIWVDDVKVVSFNKWSDSWSGTQTAEAATILKEEYANIQYNTALNFKDSYIASKIGQTIKITYKTSITNAEAVEFLNKATVTYRDGNLGDITSQSAEAVYEDTNSVVSMNKTGWAYSDKKNIGYQIDIDFDKYHELTDPALVGYTFDVVDILPAGLTFMESTNDWEFSIKAGDEYNQYVQIPWTKDTATVVVNGQEREKITFHLTMTQAVIDELIRVNTETPGNKPTIRVKYVTAVKDIPALIRDGKNSYTYTNDATVLFKTFDLTKSCDVTMGVPQVVVKDGNYLQEDGKNIYTIEINKEAYDLSLGGDTLTGIDQMGAWDYYLYDTVKVVKVVNGTETVLVKGTDYKYSYDMEKHQLIFENLPDKAHLKITYETKVQLTDGPISSTDMENKFYVYGFESDAMESADTTVSMVSRYNLRGWAISAVGDISIQKFWNNGGQMVAINGVTFDLYRAEYDATAGKMKLAEKLKSGIEITNVNGTVTISDLPLKNVYALVETNAPLGFEVEEPYYFVLRNHYYKSDANGNPLKDGAGNAIIDAEFKALMDSIPDSLNVREFASSTVVLFENEKAIGNLELTKILAGTAASEVDASKISFTITPKVGDKDTYILNEFTKGSTGVYTKIFQDIPVGNYKVVENRTDVNGHTFEKLEYTVTVDGVQQSGGTEAAGVTGTQMAAPVQSGKTTTVAMKNTYNLETTTVAGSKTWTDNNNQDGKRPASITIRLLADGTEVDRKSVTATNGWQWSFTNLPKYENGVLIHYTITEDSVTDYTTVVSGYNVTNRYTPGKTSVTVNKVWEDNNNQDGKRPVSIQVQLLADGVNCGEAVVLNAENNWKYTWTDLDQKKNGAEIKYTVKELAVDSYDVVITGDAKKGYTITNKHTPETITLSGSKTWNDNNNQDGKRPTSLTVHLLADGKEVAEQTVTAPNWTWTFANMPKYANGKEIVYTITETDVVDYSPVIDGLNITNNYTPGKTTVTVNKVWNDSNNQDGKRPESVQVQLFADSVKKGNTVTLSVANNWTHTWTELDQKNAGVVIQYTVEEVNVPNGYSATVTGTQQTGFVITNSYIPQTVKVEGSKTWNDNNNQDGKRPASLTVHLLADGAEIDQQVVTASDNWQWSFTNLPKYADGKEIVYSITETGMTDYTPTINGYNITNTYTPGKTFVTVNKIWADGNDQDGLRPESVQVQLLADGVAYGSAVTLDEANGWKHMWTNLDQKKAGVEVQYTVEEIHVPTGYTVTVNGTAKDGYTIINSHTPETIVVSGSKTWVDDNNQAGKRPASITIHLLANGTQIDSKTVTAAENWVWEFTNLNKYENGVEVKYTITEDKVADYTTVVNGYQVTNTYVKPGTEPTPTTQPGTEPTPTTQPGTEPTPTTQPGTEPTPTTQPGTEPTPTTQPGGETTPTQKPGTDPKPTAKPSTGGSGSGTTPAPTVTQAPSSEVLGDGQKPTPTSIPTVDIEVTIPKTADETPVLLWVIMMMFGLAGMTTVYVVIRRQRRDRNR